MNKLQNIIEMVHTTNAYSSDEILDAIYSIQEETTEKGIREYFSMRRAKDDYLQMDAIKDTYKGKNEKDYEAQRLAAIKKVEDMDDVSEQIEFLIQTTKEVDEGIKYIVYNQAYKQCCWVAFKIEICKRMAEAGVTLTDIVKYVPDVDMGDVYHLLRDYLGITIQISEVERRKIAEYDKEQPSSRK